MFRLQRVCLFLSWVEWKSSLQRVQDSCRHARVSAAQFNLGRPAQLQVKGPGVYKAMRTRCLNTAVARSWSSQQLALNSVCPHLMCWCPSLLADGSPLPLSGIALSLKTWWRRAWSAGDIPGLPWPYFSARDLLSSCALSTSFTTRNRSNIEVLNS